jgi:hypothetical protein
MMNLMSGARPRIGNRLLKEAGPAAAIALDGLLSILRLLLLLLGHENTPRLCAITYRVGVGS